MQRLLFSLVLETCIFLSTRYYRGLPWYYRNQHDSNLLLPLVEQYYCPRRGTSARAVLPQ